MRKIAKAARLLLAVQANVLNIFTEYRISGAEIREIHVLLIGMEESAALEIVLQLRAGREPFVVESDQLLKDCAEDIHCIIGNPNAYVQIVININANTMNGVWIRTCATYELRTE